MINPSSRNRVLTVGAAVALMVAGALPAYAKPKEIVVVGSKIKETIKDAGLRAGPGLVEAASDAVYRELRGAMQRAAANHRTQLLVHDLDDLGCLGAAATARDLIVDGDLIERLLLGRGFEAGDDIIQALSDKVYALLADAIQRTQLNARQVTLAQDL